MSRMNKISSVIIMKLQKKRISIDILFFCNKSRPTKFSKYIKRNEYLKMSNNHISIKKMTYNEKTNVARATIDYGEITLSNLAIYENINKTYSIKPPFNRDLKGDFHYVYSFDFEGKYGIVIQNIFKSIKECFIKLKNKIVFEIKDLKIMDINSFKLKLKTTINKTYSNGNQSIDILYGNITIHNAIKGKNNKGIDYISQPSYKINDNTYLHHVTTSVNLQNKILQSINNR